MSNIIFSGLFDYILDEGLEYEELYQHMFRLQQQLTCNSPSKHLIQHTIFLTNILDLPALDKYQPHLPFYLHFCLEAMIINNND